METDTNKGVRQLRKRPGPPKESLISTKVPKTNCENQNKKSVKLFDKYFPFFLEQQMLLNELRKSVREERTKQLSEEPNPHTSNGSKHSQQEGDRTVVNDQLLENPTDSNTVTNQDVETGNTTYCEFVEDNSESLDEPLVECGILQAECPIQIGLVNQHTEPIDHNPSEQYVVRNLCLEDTAHAHIASEEYLLSSNNETMCEVIVDKPSQSSEDGWQCDLAENNTSSVQSDDAIECELSREDCIDKEKFPEDSIEYNILYVSENHSSKRTNYNGLDSLYSDISSETDGVSYQVSDSHSSPHSFSDLEQQKQSSSSNSEGSTSPTISKKKQIVTVTPDSELFPCDFCSSHFNKSADLECHLNTHRGTELIFPSITTAEEVSHKKKYRDKSLMTPIYHCSVCYRPYNTDNGLKYHEKRHRNNNIKSHNLLNTNVKNSKNIKISRYRPGDKINYKCFYCSSSFVGKHTWLDHLALHQINNEYYLCPQCDFRIWHKNIILYHLNQKHKQFFNSHIFNIKQNLKDSILPPLSVSQWRGLKCVEHFEHKTKFSNKTYYKSKTAIESGKTDVNEKSEISPHVTEPNYIQTQIIAPLTVKQPLLSLEIKTAENSIVFKDPILSQDILTSDIKFSIEKVPPYSSFCIYCKKYFRTEDKCSHLVTHLDATTELYLCPLCSHSYKLAKSLINHYSSAHNPKKMRNLMKKLI